MRLLRVSAGALAAACALAFTAPGAMALDAKECSAKYKAAKEAKTLGTKTWNEFRKTECGAEGAASTDKVKEPKTEAPKAEAAAPKADAKAKAPATAPASAAVFPKGVDSKYAKESAAKARLHTCADQYKANKATHANGGLKWIQKGGGYWSECNKALKG